MQVLRLEDYNDDHVKQELDLHRKYTLNNIKTLALFAVKMSMETKKVLESKIPEDMNLDECMQHCIIKPSDY